MSSAAAPNVVYLDASKNKDAQPTQRPVYNTNIPSIDFGGHWNGEAPLEVDDLSEGTAYAANSGLILYLGAVETWKKSVSARLGPTPVALFVAGKRYYVGKLHLDEDEIYYSEIFEIAGSILDTVVRYDTASSPMDVVLEMKSSPPLDEAALYQFAGNVDFVWLGEKLANDAKADVLRTIKEPEEFETLNGVSRRLIDLYNAERDNMLADFQKAERYAQIFAQDNRNFLTERLLVKLPLNFEFEQVMYGNPGYDNTPTLDDVIPLLDSGLYEDCATYVERYRGVENDDDNVHIAYVQLPYVELGHLDPRDEDYEYATLDERLYANRYRPATKDEIADVSKTKLFFTFLVGKVTLEAEGAAINIRDFQTHQIPGIFQSYLLVSAVANLFLWRAYDEIEEKIRNVDTVKEARDKAAQTDPETYGEVLNNPFKQLRESRDAVLAQSTNLQNILALQNSAGAKNFEAFKNYETIRESMKKAMETEKVVLESIFEVIPELVQNLNANIVRLLSFSNEDLVKEKNVLLQRKEGRPLQLVYDGNVYVLTGETFFQYWVSLGFEFVKYDKISKIYTMSNRKLLPFVDRVTYAKNTSPHLATQERVVSAIEKQMNKVNTDVESSLANQMSKIYI